MSAPLKANHTVVLRHLTLGPLLRPTWIRSQSWETYNILKWERPSLENKNVKYLQVCPHRVGACLHFSPPPRLGSRPIRNLKKIDMNHTNIRTALLIDKMEYELETSWLTDKMFALLLVKQDIMQLVTAFVIPVPQSRNLSNSGQTNNRY